MHDASWRLIARAVVKMAELLHSSKDSLDDLIRSYFEDGYTHN